MEPREKRVFRPVTDPLVLDLMTYLRLERNRSRLTVEAYARDLQEFGALLAACRFASRRSGGNIRRCGASRRRSAQVRHAARGGQRVRHAHGSPEAIVDQGPVSLLQAHGVRDDDPASIVAGPKIERKLPEHLGSPTCGAVEHVAGRAFRQTAPPGSRNHGIALCERAPARRSHDHRSEDVDLKAREIRIHGKGSKERMVVFNRVRRRQLKPTCACVRLAGTRPCSSGAAVSA